MLEPQNFFRIFPRPSENHHKLSRFESLQVITFKQNNTKTKLLGFFHLYVVKVSIAAEQHKQHNTGKHKISQI